VYLCDTVALGVTVDHIRRVVIGLGSNVGDRAGHLDRAVVALRDDKRFHVMRRSPVYETAPVGGPPQGDFLNAAVLLLTSLAAREILESALDIERTLGRVRGEPAAPRTIDLDLLWIEGEEIDEPDLVIPHPRLVERAFALRPLLDLAPDAGHPRTGVIFSTLPTASTELRRHG
jgi:2-amino-4-hydroxy-6-hydroxymethyldihydropteridine diphosphokinase